MLVLERQVCRVCFTKGVRPSVPVVPFVDNLVLLRVNRGSFFAKRKAALLRHIKVQHLDWLEKIDW